MDTVDKATRSRIMASVGQRDTGVEMMGIADLESGRPASQGVWREDGPAISI